MRYILPNVVGVQVTHGISWHGMAINCSVDLSYFQHITACGLVDKGTTSFTELLNKTSKLLFHYCSIFDCYYVVEIDHVEQILLSALKRIFQVQLVY